MGDGSAPERWAARAIRALWDVLADNGWRTDILVPIPLWSDADQGSAPETEKSRDSQPEP